MRTAFLRIGVFATLIVCLATQAFAVQVNVCKWALEKVFVPPTYREVTQCVDGALKLFVPPECFLPGCNTMPHCLVTNTVVSVAAHYDDEWQWSCKLTDLDPADEFKKWLLQQVPDLPDLLIPGALVAARTEIAAMRLVARPLPNAVKQSITGLVAPFVAAGTAKFNTNDLANIRIISNTNTLAKPYLRDGFGAITLYDLVIVNDDDYRLLTSMTTTYGPTSFTAAGDPADVADSLLLMIHELVHVHQYAQLSFNTFVTTYLLEAIVHEYGDISKETEARQFELAVANTIGGSQSVELRAVRATASALSSTLNQLGNIKDQLRFIGLFKKCQAARAANCLPQTIQTVRPGLVVRPPRPKFQAVFTKLPDGRVIKMPIGGPPVSRQPLAMPANGVSVPIVDPRARVTPRL